MPWVVDNYVHVHSLFVVSFPASVNFYYNGRLLESKKVGRFERPWVLNELTVGMGMHQQNKEVFCRMCSIAGLEIYPRALSPLEVNNVFKRPCEEGNIWYKMYCYSIHVMLVGNKLSHKNKNKTFIFL